VAILKPWSTQIRPVAAELIHGGQAVRRRDVTNTIGDFCDHAHAREITEAMMMMMMMMMIIIIIIIIIVIRKVLT
jgi:hypothetical protein